MARHVSDLNELKAITEGLPPGAPIIPTDLPYDEKERRRQKLLELAVHASDISFLSRPLEVQKQQAYFLFEEFFNQGDLEREAGLPVSFLCDRTTTNVAKN